MEGNPLFRILLVILGFLVLGWPVWGLTHSAPIASPGKISISKLLKMQVIVSFAHAPDSFELDYLGETICKGAAPLREFQWEWSASLPKEGVDLFLKAKWPANSPQTAVRVQVSRDGELLADETVWGEGHVAETITIPGEKP